MIKLAPIWIINPGLIMKLWDGAQVVAGAIPWRGESEIYQFGIHKSYHYHQKNTISEVEGGGAWHVSLPRRTYWSGIFVKIDQKKKRGERREKKARW